jgi:predicted GNAT superfamily acetyltransferase
MVESPQADENAENSVYAISIATTEDIPEIVALQSMNRKEAGGALSVEFPLQWFERTMAEMPIVIARRAGHLAGYLVSSSRAATQELALPQAKYTAYPTRADAYNSGPLCIAASERGRGLATRLFDMQRALLPGREGTAFIRRDNAASRTAHASNGFKEVAEFVHAGVEYLVVARSG